MCNDQQVCDQFPISTPQLGPKITVVKQSHKCFIASVYVNRNRIARARSKNAGGAVIKAIRRFIDGDTTDLPNHRKSR